MSENTRITCFKITKQSHRAAQKNNKRGSLFLLPCPVSGGQTTVPFLTTSKGGCSTPSRPLLREPHFSIVQARHSPLFVAHFFPHKGDLQLSSEIQPHFSPMCAQHSPMFAGPAQGRSSQKIPETHKETRDSSRVHQP